MKKIVFLSLLLTACYPKADVITIECKNGDTIRTVQTEIVKDLDSNTLNETATADFVADELSHTVGGQWVCTATK